MLTQGAALVNAFALSGRYVYEQQTQGDALG